VAEGVADLLYFVQQDCNQWNPAHGIRRCDRESGFASRRESGAPILLHQALSQTARPFYHLGHYRRSRQRKYEKFALSPSRVGR
jgi:hypothetical protein